MKWRSTAPHASRTHARRHRSQPFTFYTAAVNGGVWKTTDAGAPDSHLRRFTGSIGTVVAPSDPNRLRRQREGVTAPPSTGDGVYKSTEGK